MDLRVRHRAEVAEQRVETERFTETKKITEKQIKNQSHVDGFFDCHGIVHHEFAPEDQTVNATFYMEVLKRLRYCVRRMRPELCEGRLWILHHDNAPAYSALIVREFLACNSITVLEHPSYSLDLAPCDFFLVPQMQIGTAGAAFGGCDDD